MNNLAIKEVNFNGDTLIAAQDKTTEKVYVGVSWVCQGVGLTESQKDRQVANIQSDIVLKNGAKKLPLKFEGQVRELLCIDLEFLPLWLAKISITPKMQKDSPETVDNLVEYQLKAKDVLSNAFIHNVKQIVPQTYKEALLALVESIEEKEKLEAENRMLLPKAQIHDQIANAENVSGVKKIGKNIGIGEIKFFEFLRATKIFYKEGKDNLPYQNYQNQGYFEVKVKTNTDKEGNTFNTYTTKVTGKGELFLLNIVNKYGGAELINRLKVKEIRKHVEDYKFKAIVIK